MRTSLRALTVAAVLVTAALPREAGAAPAATTVEGEGCTKETEAGSCREAKTGAQVATQTTFIASKGGATLEFSDKSRLRLPEGSEVRILPRTRVQYSASQDTPASVIMLVKGKAFVSLAGGNKPKMAMLVKGPHQIQAIVKSGNAVLRVTDEGLVVGALSGSTLIAAGNDWNEVHAGHARTVKKSDTKGVSRELIAAPEIVGATPLRLQIEGIAAEPYKVRWKPVPSAERYEVEVQMPSGAPQFSQVPKGTTELSLGSLPPGTYVAQVRAIDGEDLESPWSPPARTSLVGVEVPKGAVMLENQAIQLPEGAKLRLRSTDGLEASFNDFAMFVAPPSEVGLLAGRAQVLRLRRKGETDELRVRLEPRTVKADIDLRPKNARWPRDPVSVEIKLVTAEGKRATGDVELVPTVTIDVEPVTVSWTKEPGLLRGVVQPKLDGKPHIVRVEVHDQFGFFLGRNFLEVALEGK